MTLPEPQSDYQVPRIGKLAHCSLTTAGKKEHITQSLNILPIMGKRYLTMLTGVVWARRKLTAQVRVVEL